MKTLGNDSLRKIVVETLFSIKANQCFSVSLGKHSCGNIMFSINVSLFVYLDKHCCGNAMLIPVCPPQETLFSKQNWLLSKWKNRKKLVCPRVSKCLHLQAMF